MTKCVRCGKGGAKRPCPALEGELCARCCAQHQGRDIACPQSCSFLRQGIGKDDYQTAVAKLVDFALEYKVLAHPAFTRIAGPEKTVGDWEEPLIIAYAAYGHADAQGQRAIDILLRDQYDHLKAGEVEALEALRSTVWPSIFEIQAVEVDVGFHFFDLVTGDSLFVHEKAATHELKKFDVMLGWIVRLGERLEMTGAAVAVPRGHLEVVLKAVKKELRRLRKSAPGSPARVLLREAVVVAQQTLRAAIDSWQPPQMRTVDGEEIAFCESVFDVSDADGVLARLMAHPDLEEDNDDFVWLDRKGRQRLGAGPLLLGSIRIERGRLMLQTHSHERLELGKQLLIDYLEGVARHRIDAVKDLDVAMKEFAARPVRTAAPEVPAEVRDEVLVPFLQQRLESWIDESIPALNGQSPRDAVKTKAGRTRVVAMLKDQENLMQRQPGGDRLDFSAVYRKLGILKP